MDTDQLKQTQIYQKRPLGFVPSVQVAGVFVEVKGELLLLQLNAPNTEEGKWGTPAGKLETGETALEGALRELFEETGISPLSSHSLEHLGELFIKTLVCDYVYHTFLLSLPEKPPVTLSLEHMAYRWATKSEIHTLPLRMGGKEALDFYYEHPSLHKKIRKGAIVSVYLLLEKEDQVLLHLRQNTGYCDGYYGLVSGHVEEKEGAKEAMMRKAKEEAGILLDPEDLEMVHMIYRQTNRANIDLFFRCKKWQGVIENKEPGKCADLSFFPLDSLPTNLIGYIKETIDAISTGTVYAEIGWK